LCNRWNRGKSKVICKAVEKQSQKECLELNKEVIVVVRIDGCDPTTAREIYEDRAPERNLPWVANVIGI
jgi:hypothetical protein